MERGKESEWDKEDFSEVIQLLKGIRSSAVLIMNEKTNEIFMHLGSGRRVAALVKTELQPKRLFLNEDAWKFDTFQK